MNLCKLNITPYKMIGPRNFTPSPNSVIFQLSSLLSSSCPEMLQLFTLPFLTLNCRSSQIKKLIYWVFPWQNLPVNPCHSWATAGFFSIGNPLVFSSFAIPSRVNSHIDIKHSCLRATCTMNSSLSLSLSLAFFLLLLSFYFYSSIYLSIDRSQIL